MTARVAIVGRPNVGKSTLVNRLAGRRTAIVEEQAGVTRDRKVVPVEWTGRSFEIVDTGGWMPGGTALDEKVSRQSEKAMEESDIVIFVVDGTTGVTEEDAQAAAVLRRKNKLVLLVVNKIDDPRRENMIWDFMELGLGEPRGLSALHGPGSADLLDELLTLIPEETERVEGDDEWSDGDEIAVAIVGRPNVGKSTLFNALTRNDVLAANYPFATIEPNVGVVPLPDPRLGELATIHGSADREKLAILSEASGSSEVATTARTPQRSRSNRTMPEACSVSMAMTRPPASGWVRRTFISALFARTRTDGSHSPCNDRAVRSRWAVRVRSRASPKDAAWCEPSADTHSISPSMRGK